MIDKFRRKLFLKSELRRLLLKFVVKNTLISQAHRYLALYSYSKISRTTARIQAKNRCVKTGRIWAVRKQSGYSRFVFQREAYHGHLPGFKRASW